MENDCPLSQKIEILLEMIPDADGRPHTLTEIAEAGGVALNTISRLKTGRIEDPRLSTLIIIARFFDIPLDYFSCESAAACRRFLQEELQRRKTVPEIALRVREMSDEVMANIHHMVSYIEQFNIHEPSQTYPEHSDE